jgi:hypothetical protein
MRIDMIGSPIASSQSRDSPIRVLRHAKELSSLRRIDINIEQSIPAFTQPRSPCGPCRLSSDACPYGGLRPETVEDGSDREGMRCRGHLRGGLGMQWCERFVLSILAGGQRGKLCLSACRIVRCPPLAELLVPSGAAPGAADIAMRPPYGGMPMRVHCRVLLPWPPHR